MNLSGEPIDEIHRLSMYAVSAIREDFGKLKARVAVWEPRPCPEVMAEPPYDPHIPYLDEIDLPRKWFR